MSHRLAGLLGIWLVTACSAPPGDGRAADVSGAGEAVAETRSCGADPVPASAVRTARDVTYTTREGRPLRMDVAWSESGPPAPLVLLLHGGSWSGGSRASMHGEMLALARRGYTAAAVEYRLARAPHDVFPAAPSDVRCALRTLRRRAAEFHVAPGRVAAMGYSAGGHLASLLGVSPEAPALGTDGCEAAGDSVRIQAVVSYAGPQDLRVNETNAGYTQEQAELVTNFLGIFPGDDPPRASLASPVAQVERRAPPFLLVHGTSDSLVPPRHAREMARALRAAGTPATVLDIPGIGHGYVGMLASRDARVRCTVEAFLARWLR